MIETVSDSAVAQGDDALVDVIQRLSLATELSEIVDIVRRAARSLADADGATFVLREGDRCHYVDEDAIAPLWRGQRFPMDRCVSGWAMRHATPVVIEDIYADERIPRDAYEPTFVKSLLMVPIRRDKPIGAIGVYWATRHAPTGSEIRALSALANSTSVALTNVELLQGLRKSLAEAQRSRDELAREVALRDDFISLASHELRTPLTPLVMQMHVLRATNERRGRASEDADDTRRIARAIDIAERKLDELGNLSERMLDVSRIAMGRLAITPTEGVDLGAVVRAAIVSVDGAEAAPIVTRIAEGVVGRWDARRVAQIVALLVENALKFGKREPIEVEALGDETFATIRVRDRGIGVDPSEHGKIFERFGRAAEMTSFGGLGLGLYLARALASAHEGSIAIESRLGEGATFTVTLPRDAR